MTEGFRDIIWLAGQVFLWRDFVIEAEEKGLEVVFEKCPYGDLSDDQREAFQAAFNHPELRKVVETWWKTYDAARRAGEIPITSYWH